MIAKVAIAVVGGFLGWIYTRIKPPPPRVNGSPGGPPITSPRIQLNDGRHLSNREWGVSKDKANYKIIVIHGFDSSKDMKLPISQSFWIDGQTSNLQSNEVIALDNNSAPLYDRGYTFGLTSTD